MWKRTCLFMGLLAVVITTMAQPKASVTGTVKDADNGELLIGVNILVEGTSIGVTTGLDGDYSIDAPDNATLVFSYIGYNALKVKIAGKKVIDVSLTSDAQQLDELVVVGYTTIKRRDVLGAVSKVGADALSALPVSNTAQALQGRVAGVQISNANGAPGSKVSVRIRGVGSLYSGNDPLYIVDGVPMTDALNNISPGDIENVSVLKDASSAAIYGSRANNGVVLITTKSGKQGKVKVSYHGQFGMQTHGKLMKMANTSQYVNLYNEATRNDNLETAVKRPYLEGAWLERLADVDHVSSIFRIAPLFSQEISVSGATEKTNYAFSGSYFKQDGIIKNSGYDRGTLRANINSEVNNWLSMGMNLSGGLSSTASLPSSGDGYQNSEGGSVVRYAMFRNPGIPSKTAEGVWIDRPSTYFGNSMYDTFLGDGHNPLGIIDNTDRKQNEETVFSNMYVNFKLPFNFKLVNNFGLDYNNNTSTIYNKSWGDDLRINNPNSFSISNTRNLNWVINSVLHYQPKLGKNHHLAALFGFEAVRNTSRSIANADQKFPVWDKNLIFIGGGLGEKTYGQSEWASTLASFFAQVNYDYLQRYYFSAIIRRDGSSRFYGDNKWGTFYSASVGWNLDQEAFMQNVDVVSKLKLRAGWGAIGNQDIGVYAYSDRYNPNYDYPFGGISNSGYAQYMLGNPDLKWETSNQLNVGVDLELWQGAFGFSADFYNKVTTDMLMRASVPPSIGHASSAWINSGSVLNRGVDVELIYRKNYKEGGFDIALNAGFLKNEVLEIDAPFSSGRVDNGVYATRTQVGQSIGSFYMYEMAGIFQNETEILTSAYQGMGIKPGDVKFTDVNEDGKIDLSDRKFVGSAIPKVTMGLTFNGHWKGFDVSAFFQGAFGQKIYNQVLTDSEGFYRGFNVTERYAENRWTGENSTNEFPRASWRAKGNNARVSTRFLEDGSYLRLKNMQLGYTFNSKPWGVEKLRVYLAATNLFTLTKYTGFDPEMTVSANSSAEGDRASGIDWGTYPVPVTYTLGINLTF